VLFALLVVACGYVCCFAAFFFFLFLSFASFRCYYRTSSLLHHSTTSPLTTSPLHHFTTSPLHHFTTSPLHHSKKVIKRMYAAPADTFWACDTEVAEIDIKKQGPVGNGNVTCVSIFGGEDIDFGDGKG
jgi:hypothetical protein